MSLVSLNHYNRSYFYPDDRIQENLSDITKLHFDENEFQSMITETLKKRKSANIDIQQIYMDCEMFLDCVILLIFLCLEAH